MQYIKFIKFNILIVFVDVGFDVKYHHRAKI
jgi:hypothetical protein